ncbi:sorbosone dehydrogenase family protein [Mucilaginibacter sp. UR6-11]|uniref:PQQ-dependent sugar dehydrogenase n=1 Tax=Mucilaginibacter sp. UR6-11 TaxID=1435644 RepID=UPI001E54C369|nr:PQQ-dependent sugar dehydrogenase [Mucilaginibacter sp. UR6-11]MCC8426054.1 PQQ-dependent sugar dehydrogenase [Mucilaginibacter sp. UR6-11]
MRKRFSSRLIVVIAFGGVSVLLLPSYVFNKPRPVSGGLAPTISLKAQQLVTGLQAPLDMAFTGNGDILVAEQAGKIRLIKNGKLTAAPVLDISSKLIRTMPVDVRGLLGFALHPKFKSNHKVYVFYSAPTTTENADHKNIIAEYTLSTNSTQVDPDSGRILFTADEPGQGDNGGCLKFGPDGYLYIAMGDGGGGGDKHGPIGNGQNMNTLLGKILRIDVNSDLTYIVPKDNPFVGKTDVRPEIWAYGLRNTWRFSFDKVTRQLFTSDVGEGAWEEQDIIERGGNYGWRITEGNHCFNPKADCDFTGTIKPISEYDHKSGVCVIGGYVYHGRQLPSANKGKYFFADWTGPIYYIEKNSTGWQRGKVELQNYPQNLKITSWGEDPSGEIYVITNGGTLLSDVKGAIYKIVK